MILSDIKDVERYLENDCYCAGEIYDSTGFFFNVYEPNEECEIIKESDTRIVAICRNQILVFAKIGNKVVDAARCDATENNIKVIVKFIDGIREDLHLDEFKKGSKDKSLKEILSLCDAVMV